MTKDQTAQRAKNFARAQSLQRGYKSLVNAYCAVKREGIMTPARRDQFAADMQVYCDLINAALAGDY